MKIYHYDKSTKEFTFAAEAEANPEETKIKGEFVPLIPACATTIEPPEIKENEAAVFNIEINKWDIKPDYRKNFKICNENQGVLTAQDIKEIGEINEGYLVLNEIAELIKSNPQHFKINNGKVLEKTEAEIEAETKEAERQAKIAEIKIKLEEIDKQKIRAITEPEIKNKETKETWLEYYNGQAKILRKELQNLENSKSLSILDTEANESEGNNEQ